jgi:hypothetical protein
VQSYYVHQPSSVIALGRHQALYKWKVIACAVVQYVGTSNLHKVSNKNSVAVRLRHQAINGQQFTLITFTKAQDTTSFRDP